MADNFTANPGADGDTFGADDIGGTKFPRSKIIIGDDGVNDGDVSAANPLPVTGTVAVTHAALTELGAAVNGSSQVDVNIAASAATVAVSNAGLTELAAAVNASSQMDVNIAASNATVAVSNAGLTELAAAVNGSSQVDVNIAAQGGALTVASHAVTNAGTFAVQPGPTTSGGLLTARSLDLDDTEEEVKATAGQVYGWNITNLATGTRYVKFYNATAANVTVGTTTPLFTLAIPGNATDDTMLAQALAHGITFDTAITWAATTGLADNDTGAPGANEVAGTVWYK